MPPDDVVRKVWAHFYDDVKAFVQKGHQLPTRVASRFGADALDRAAGAVGHGAHMGKESAGEFLSHNKRKLVPPIAGAAAGVAVGVGVGVGAAAVSLTAPVSLPVVAVGGAVAVTVGLGGLAISQGVRHSRYKEARAAIEAQYQLGNNKFDIDKVIAVIRGGGLSYLAWSYQKARKAMDEYKKYSASTPFPKSMGSQGGTCFRAAEHLWKLLYVKKRLERLSEDGKSSDHRLRNALLFMDLVPRALYTKVESLLDTHGQRAVQDLFKFPSDQIGAQQGAVALQDEGLLTWATWARMYRQNPNAAGMLSKLVAAGKAKGDPKGLVANWGALTDLLTDVMQDPTADTLIDPARATSAQQQRLGAQSSAILQGQFQAPAMAVTVGKPLASLALSKALSEALVRGSITSAVGWGVSGASTVIGGPVGALVGILSTVAVEAINAKLDMNAIFDKKTSPADRIWSLQSVLQSSGLPHLLEMRTGIGEMEPVLTGLGDRLSRCGTVNEIREPLRLLIANLYRLHNWLAQLTVQMTLWEFLVAFIQGDYSKMTDDADRDMKACSREMSNRLRDDNPNGQHHKNCKSACYCIVTVTHQGQPAYYMAAPIARA